MPTITTQHYPVGDLNVKLEGENWGKGLEDTKVSIGGQYLCWIHWDSKDKFIDDLKAVVEKHRI